MHYRRPEPHEAETLLLQLAAGFDGYRAFAPAGWEPPDTLTPEQVERCRAALRDPDAFALIALDGETPVGHVLWVPAREGNRDDGPLIEGLVHLRQLFVLEPWWGSGVARTLHERAVGEMRRRGWPSARLFTPSGQARARRFYEREGWRLHEVRPDERLGLDVAEYRLAVAAAAPSG